MLKTNLNVLNLSILTFVLMLSCGQVQSANKTFEKVCKSCHTGGFKGFMSGAPNVKDKKAWQKYLERHSYEQMKKIVLQGNEEHKVKGGCTKCSDEEILGAIDYILQRVNSKEGNK